MPSWVDEGETWVPAGGIQPMDEDQSCPKDPYPPDGYVYMWYTTGNSLFEAFTANPFINFTGFITGLGPITFAISTVSAGANLVYAVQHEGRVQARYFKYVYTNGKSNWYHYIWVYQGNGYSNMYLDCATKIEMFT